MDYSTLRSIIEKKKLSQVYFFFGEEVYFIEDLVKKIIEYGTEQGTKDFNCDILQAEEVDGETVVRMASSFPMMTDRRIVVLKSVQKFPESDKKRILMYIKSPLESTSLILTAGKVDQRQSFYNSLIQNSQWVECKPLYENQAVEWVRRYFREKGVTLSGEGAALLVQQAGTSLWSLYNEAEKLLIFTWGKKELELNDVELVVGFSRKFNTWELTDAVGRKDLSSALTVLKRLLEEGVSPVGLIIVLTQRILLLMRIRSVLDKGISREETARTLNIRPYFMKLYMNQVRQFSAAELESAIKILLNADLYIKTGYLKPTMAMTLLIYELIKGETRVRFYG